MTFFQEVYDRIRCATNARTQTELAAVLDRLHREYDFQKIQEIIGYDTEEGLGILEKYR